jgi:ATP-dependent RNA helicase DeaD
VLIVPVRRYSAAIRVLSLANAQGTVRSAPTAADIEARYREQILEAATSAAVPEEAEAAFVAELLTRVTAEQLAAAYLRQQLSTRPAPEDISPVPMPSEGKMPKVHEAVGKPRTERRDMTGSAWFSLSVGRNKRAEPRWILPLICKAGGITRDDVGSIKIFDDETRFEITAEKAAAFAERVATGGSGEKGITISSAQPKIREARDEPAAPRKAWQTPRPAADDVPGNEAAADGPAKPAKRPWAKPDFAKKGPKAKAKPGDFKPKKSFGAAGKPKYKSKTKAPK